MGRTQINVRAITRAAARRDGQPQNQSPVVRQPSVERQMFFQWNAHARESGASVRALALCIARVTLRTLREWPVANDSWKPVNLDSLHVLRCSHPREENAKSGGCSSHARLFIWCAPTDRSSSLPTYRRKYLLLIMSGNNMSTSSVENRCKRTVRSSRESAREMSFRSIRLRQSVRNPRRGNSLRGKDTPRASALSPIASARKA